MKSLPLWLLVALLLVAGGAWFIIHGLQRQLVKERVVASNSLASLDSSRLAIKRDGDSAVAVATRRGFQDKVKLRKVFQDSLKETGVALARFRLEAESLRAVTHDSARVDTVSGAVMAWGGLDTMDLKIQAEVTVDQLMPLPTSTWKWDVVRRPLPLDLALSCEGPHAIARLAGPPWSKPVLDSVVQVPGICNPMPAGWKPFSLQLPGIVPSALLLGVGVVVGVVLSP